MIYEGGKMKEKTKLIILILVFVLLLILINNFMKDKSTNIIADNEKSKQSNNTAESNVIDVYEENFEKEVLNSDKRVLIDFYATWCGPCKQLSPIIDKVSLETENIKFVRIDVDKNEELSTKYGIQYMPTLVLIDNGKEVDRSIGLIDKDSLLKFIGK